MKPLEFKNAWIKTEANLQPVSLQKLSRFKLNKETADFLSESGLPSAAAPFLSFVGVANPNDKYSFISFITEWFDFLEPEYHKYVAIGTDGSGDVIVINTENNFTIEWLDHEDFFSSRFMNSSINQLANYLLCYRDFLHTINSNETADNDFSNQQFNALHDAMQDIDERALKEGFWKEELELLLTNSENARGKL